MPARSEADFLRELRRRGVRRVRQVRYRANRSTIWSLTQGGSVLNVHLAYRCAPASILDAFAALLRSGDLRGASARAAAREIRHWPGLEPVLRAVREAHALRAGRRGPGPGGGGPPVGTAARCCGTPGQRHYLRDLYRYLNRTRFAGLLPDDVPIRLSRRMTASLGHMVPGWSRRRGRFVREVALNVDLLLPGNGAERMDTLIHEMAHVAAYLFDGHAGHGEPWRSWARRAGCRVEVRYDRPIVRRRRGESVTRVPPLPASLRRRVA